MGTLGAIATASLACALPLAGGWGPARTHGSLASAEFRASTPATPRPSSPSVEHRRPASTDSDTVWVAPPPPAPSLDAVVARGDSVFFAGEHGILPYGVAASAYTYDRQRGTFARIARPPWLDSLPPRPGAIADGLRYWCEAVANGDSAWSAHLADSLDLVARRLSNGRSSCALRVAGHRTIDLRAARIAREQRWRVQRHRPPTPQAPDARSIAEDPDGPRADTWAPLDVGGFAVDPDAIWIGLATDRAQYGELALGGLVRIDRRTLAVSFPDTLLLHASIVQLVPARAGYLVVASGGPAAPGSQGASADDDGRLYRLHSSDGTIAPLPLPSATVVTVVNDTAWVAGTGMIAALDLRTGTSRSRGFRLATSGDSLVYELADSTVEPSWSVLGAAGLATDYIHGYGSPRPGALLRAAMPSVRAVALVYYDRGDRVPFTVPLDHDTIAVRALATTGYSLDDAGRPAMIGVTGASAPAIRALLQPARRAGSVPK